MAYKDLSQLIYDIGSEVDLGGSSSAYTATTARAINAYFRGLLIRGKANHDNTAGGTTLDLNGIGAASVKLQDGSDPGAGAIKNGGVYTFSHDGTNFQLLDPNVTGSTTETIQDAAWDVLTGVQTLITVTYDDANNEVDFVVDEASIDHDALTNYVANEHIDWTSASANFSTSGSVTAASANGIDVNPGSDTDADLVTVNVTGSPKLSWDESADAFVLNKSFSLASGYADLSEISEPSSPSANVARIFALDVGGTTVFATKDSGGRVRLLGFQNFHVAEYGAVGSGDEETNIQAAIDAAESAGGGAVIFDATTYDVGATIYVDNDNVLLVGQGRGGILNGKAAVRDSAATTFKWTGGVGTGPIVKFTSDRNDGGSEDRKTGGGILDIFLDGQENVEQGLHIESWFGGRFRVHTAYCTDIHILMDVLSNGTSASPSDTQENLCDFICSDVNTGSEATSQLVLNGVGSANCSLNQYRLELRAESAAVALELGDCDGNVFDRVKAGTRQAASGDGGKVIFHADDTISVVTAANNARHNTIKWIQATEGIVSKQTSGGSTNASDNIILGLSRGNGSPLPTIESGSTLYYWTDEGVISLNHLDVVNTATLPNAGPHLEDTDASHDLIVSPGSNLTADRTLTLTTGDADRTLTLSANVALDQNLRTTDDVQFQEVVSELDDDAAAEGPDLTLRRIRSSPAAFDQLGRFIWYGRNDNNANVAYGSITMRSTGVSAGSEDGRFFVITRSNGTDAVRASIQDGVRVGDASSAPPSDGVIDAQNGYEVDGGTVVIDGSGGIRNQTDTATNIADSSATVNTTDKAAGKQVWDTTNNRLMIASGSGATADWHVADGSTSVTPS